MEDYGLLSSAADSITQQPEHISVDIVPANRIERWLIKSGIKRSKRTYQVKPMYVGTLIRVSKKVLTIPDELSEEYISSPERLITSLAADHALTICEVIAMAIQNNEHDLEQKLVDRVKRELNIDEMLYVLKLVLRQMKLDVFFQSTVIISGLNILKQKKTDLQEPDGLIASGTLSDQ